MRYKEIRYMEIKAECVPPIPYTLYPIPYTLIPE